MKAIIIRVDGNEECMDLRFREIAPAIGADAMDHVSLRDGRIMLVDDLGHSKGLAVNRKATLLYHSVCKPGTVHAIVGDVAIIRDTESRS